MDADSFVAGLRECAFNLSAFEVQGIPSEVVAEYVGGFICEARTIQVEPLADPLLDFVHRYHAEFITIGLVKFAAAIIESPTGWIVGSFEVDPIVIHRDSGEVRVLDHIQPGFDLWRCAQSSSAFLDALLHAACYPPFRAPSTDASNRLERARECSDHAGGDEYLSFYKVLFGL